MMEALGTVLLLMGALILAIAVALWAKWVL